MHKPLTSGINTGLEFNPSSKKSSDGYANRKTNSFLQPLGKGLLRKIQNEIFPILIIL